MVLGGSWGVRRFLMSEVTLLGFGGEPILGAGAALRMMTGLLPSGPSRATRIAGGHKQII